jgi:dolichol-phosphate mannosyltransferase
MRRDAAHPTPAPHAWPGVSEPGKPPALSVVVPVFEEEAVVPVLVERLARVLDGLGVAAEVILVDDGSRDGTWAEVVRAHRADPRFVGLSLSRNFGHQAAISAGLAEASGEAVLVMDGDLQDPPEAIPGLWARYREGFDVVYAIRASRPEGPLKRLAYATFYRLLGLAVSIPIPKDAGDFGLMSRRVVDLVVGMPERRRYVRGLRAWVGFRQVGVPIDRGARHAGRPKYTLSKLLGLAIDGLVGFGEGPLRPVGMLGVVAVGLSVLGATGAGARAAWGGDAAPGWAWVGLGLLFFGGAQLLSTAIVGEYVARILQEVNGRPLYVARHRVGLGPTQRSGARPRATMAHPADET